MDAICLDHITVEEAGEIGWDENDQRQQMTDLDYGERFDALLRQDNPLTQKPYTIQEVADKYGKNYHWVRGRAALPYLPVEHQQQVEDGTCNITEACNLALRCKAKALNEETGAAKQDKGDCTRRGGPGRVRAAGAAQARREPPSGGEAARPAGSVGPPLPWPKSRPSSTPRPKQTSNAARRLPKSWAWTWTRLRRSRWLARKRSKRRRHGRRAACPQGRGGLSDLLRLSGHDHRAHHAGRR